MGKEEGEATTCAHEGQSSRRMLRGRGSVCQAVTGGGTEVPKVC